MVNVTVLVGQSWIFVYPMLIETRDIFHFTLHIAFLVTLHDLLHWWTWERGSKDAKSCWTPFQTISYTISARPQSCPLSHEVSGSWRGEAHIMLNGGGNEKHDIVTKVMKDYHPHPPLLPPPPPPPPHHHHHHHHHEFRFYIISHHKIFTSQAECWTLAVLASSIRVPTSHECFGDVAPRPPLSLSPGFANSPNRHDSKDPRIWEYCLWLVVSPT